jgi:MFS family permease
MNRVAVAAARRGIEYKWIALSVTTIGAMTAAIDGTIVVLALPDMMGKLQASLIEMIWVIMGYILVSTVFLLTFGRVADMLGRVRMYNLGFVVFTIGSALCGLSRNATQLILARLVQGAGAAMDLLHQYPRRALRGPLGVSRPARSLRAESARTL